MKLKGRTYAKLYFSLIAGFSYSCQIQCTSQDSRIVDAIKNARGTKARGTNRLDPYSY